MKFPVSFIFHSADIYRYCIMKRKKLLAHFLVFYAFFLGYKFFLFLVVSYFSVCCQMTFLGIKNIFYSFG